ncbi:site-specific tyrosine recombinase XerC [Dokdonella soli]|uniref:Site-specific tyrosine recombinase XerD n=1 Tax=Dokdonella soli TaxID=529810 RepID=A0ABN1IP79_9GAMM
MHRRKPPTPRARPADLAEQNGLFPYLVRFIERTAALGLSGQTAAMRDRELRRFLRWCRERDIERPQDVTRPILERYRAHLFHRRKANGEPLSFATQQYRLIAVKVFFRWLTRENFILSNPASELELPKVVQRLPRHVLGIEDIERVFAQTARTGALGVRDRAILETFYATGIRRMELANLRLHDVDVRQGTVLVREGKGGKDRYVPLGERAAYWIVRYRDELRPELVIEPDRGVLFLHEYGEPFHKDRLSDLVKKYLRAAGLDVVGSCHLFRHAMATHMLNNGADIRFLQALLGHSQMKSTEVYTHVAIDKLKAVHAATHPGARLASVRATRDPDAADDRDA